MNDRLQRKCVVGSALMHGLLCCILMFGAAFSRPTQNENLPPLHIVALNLPVSDKPSTGGGGAPTPQPAPQPAPPTPVQPTPAPPKVEQPPPDPVKIPDPPKPVKIKTPKVEKVVEKVEKTPIPMVKDNDITLKDAPEKPVKKHEVKPNLDKEVETGAARRAAEAERIRKEKEREAREDAEYRERVDSALTGVRTTASTFANNVKNSGAGKTVVDLPGQGGGAAFANYRDLVYSAYFHAWLAPEEVISTESTVEAKIVVSRDGTVVSANITKPSHNKALDNSVSKALRKVDHLPAFPKETSDSERSFLIIFDLEAKRQLG